MLNFWTLTIPTLIGSIAWLYQKAWERQERRIKQYEEVIELLPYFTSASLSVEKMNAALSVFRKLWLTGPDEVIKKFERFSAALEDQQNSNEDREMALGAFVLCMRNDATFLSVLKPRFITRLQPETFRLKTAGTR